MPRRPATTTPAPARQSGPALARAALQAHLARSGLKHSRQRELVAEVFFATAGHVAVEELIQQVRRSDPRISVATVYRTMKLLAECGLAAPRQFDGGQTRYEPAAGRPHHDHLICTGCGEIVEFANEQIEALQVRVAARHGFLVETHKLELYGRCLRCRPARAAGEGR
ncbi:MAG: transcriptional repressor [Anaeromyxobacter sp.]|nr:transcriptional repressor [Anaeromyxobacter sp.]MBL0277812.1 transcriptional repressor [Anaeromyxobacter sp.]